MSSQPRAWETRSTRDGRAGIRIVPKLKDPVPMATTTTTIKRTSTAAWAWQVINQDGTDWRQGIRSSRAAAEGDTRAARDALKGGGTDLNR